MVLMRAYQIISGSDGKSYIILVQVEMDIQLTSGSYGLFLPDIGTLLLNGNALDLEQRQMDKVLSLGTVTNNSNTAGDNPLKLLELSSIRFFIWIKFRRNNYI